MTPETNMQRVAAPPSAILDILAPPKVRSPLALVLRRLQELFPSSFGTPVPKCSWPHLAFANGRARAHQRTAALLLSPRRLRIRGTLWFSVRLSIAPRL